MQSTPFSLGSALECALLLVLLRVLDSKEAEGGVSTSVFVDLNKSGVGSSVHGSKTCKVASRVSGRAEKGDHISEQRIRRVGVLGQHLKGPPTAHHGVDGGVGDHGQQISITLIGDAVDHVSLLLNTEASVAETGSEILLQQTSVQKMRMSHAADSIDQHSQLHKCAGEDGGALADADVLDGKPGILVHDRDHRLISAVDAAKSKGRALRSFGMLGNHDHFLAGDKALEARVEGLGGGVNMRDLTFPVDALGAREELLHESFLAAEFDVHMAVADARLAIVVAALLETCDGELGLVNRVKFNKDIHGLASGALHYDVDSEVGSALGLGSDTSATAKSGDDFVLGGAIRDIADLDDSVGARTRVSGGVDKRHVLVHIIKVGKSAVVRVNPSRIRTNFRNHDSLAADKRWLGKGLLEKKLATSSLSFRRDRTATRRWGSGILVGKAARFDECGEELSLGLRLLDRFVLSLQDNSTLSLLDGASLRLLRTTEWALGLLRTVAPTVGSTSMAHRAANWSRTTRLRHRGKGVRIHVGSHERTVGIDSRAGVDKGISLSRQRRHSRHSRHTLVVGHVTGHLVVHGRRRVHLLTLHREATHLRALEVRVLHVVTVHVGTVRTEAVRERAVLVGSGHVEAARVETIQVSTVGEVTATASDVVADMLRHRTAHRRSRLSRVAHGAGHGGCGRGTLHVNRRHHVSGTRTLDGTRGLLDVAGLLTGRCSLGSRTCKLTEGV